MDAAGDFEDVQGLMPGEGDLFRGAAFPDGDPWEFHPEELEDGDNEEDKLRLGAFLTKMTSSGKCSQSAAQEFLRFFTRQAENVARMKRDRVRFRSAKSLMKNTRKKICPKTTTDLFSVDQAGVETREARVEEIPLELLQSGRIARMETSVSFPNVFRHALATHHIDPENVPPAWRTIDLLSDGVTFAKGGSWKYHLVCISFAPCGLPHPLYVHRSNANRGGKVNSLDILTPIVNYLRDEGGQFTLRRTIGDSLERKTIKGLLETTNAYFACEVCLQPGERVEGDQKKRISYPKKDRHFERRTTARLRQILLSQYVLFLAAGEPKNWKWNSILGYKRWTPLLDLPGFDVIQNGPLDQMHMAFLGLCRKIYILIFVDGPQADQGNRDKKAVRDRCRQQINEWLKNVRIPKELGRRTREVNYKTFKGTEWRFLALFAFPWIATSELSEGLDPRIKQILLLFSFLVRALNLENDDFENLRETTNLKELFDRLQITYEEVFGRGESTFNEHSWFRHALETRIRHGPLHLYSAWRLESTLARFKRSVCWGTRNESKQLLNAFYADDYFFHCCPHQKRIHYSTKNTGKADDSLIRVGDRLYKITGMQEGPMQDDDEDLYGYLICKTFSIRPFYTDAWDLDLPWDKVLVWARDDEEDDEGEEVQIARHDVEAKLVRTGDIISDCSLKLIQE